MLLLMNTRTKNINLPNLVINSVLSRSHTLLLKLFVLTSIALFKQI
jgi:hypothetical protein